MRDVGASRIEDGNVSRRGIWIPIGNQKFDNRAQMLDCRP